MNFGIAFPLSGLMGQVLNDGGQGIAGVTVTIRSRGLKWSAVTAADGSYFLPSLVAGEYDVQVDEDSLPAGYSAEALVQPRKVIVGASSPGKATFTARAFRSISGRVLTYDPKAGQYVPVSGAAVSLGQGLTTMTDQLGRYLFRDLPAGSYTISARYQVQTSTKTVRLSAQPVDLTNVHFQLMGQFE